MRCVLRPNAVLVLAFLAPAVALPGPAGAQPAGAQPAGGTYAITDVAVVPMDRERVVRGQTVVVRDGRIAEIGDAARVRVPAGAARIDGRGKYLLPGLADMHAHLFSDAELPDSLAGDELAVMLASGVTTVRLMIGTPEQLALRRRVAAGEVLGPRVYAASPQLAGREIGAPFNGIVVTTPEQARAAVRRVKADGYDFVKLTFFISRPVYDAVVDEAAKAGIRVIGHVDRQVGLERALAAGQQIEHLDGYLEAVLADGAPNPGSVSGVYVWRPDAWESLDHVDDAKIARVAAATARAGVWSTPTLTFLKKAFGTGQTDEEIRARPDWGIIPAKVRGEMEGPRARFWAAPPSEARRRRYVEVRNRLTKAIHDAGGRILAGSDAPEWYLLYGYTLHRELESLVEAGLTPYQALEAATRNPAEWLGALDEAGTVERGKRADLVLVDADPLRDVRNAARIEGVMVRGRWLPRAELRALVERAAARFQAALPADAPPAGGAGN